MASRLVCQVQRLGHLLGGGPASRGLARPPSRSPGGPRRPFALDGGELSFGLGLQLLNHRRMHPGILASFQRSRIQCRYTPTASDLSSTPHGCTAARRGGTGRGWRRFESCYARCWCVPRVDITVTEGYVGKR